MIIVKKVFKLLEKNNLTISFAESMTGGLLSYELTKNKNASNYLKGSFVVYQNEMKSKVLNISNNDIHKYGVVSKQIVNHMVNNLFEITNTNICISVSGNADFSYEENGKLYFYYAILVNNELKTFKGVLLNKSRIKNIKETCSVIYDKLYSILVEMF